MAGRLLRRTLSGIASVLLYAVSAASAQTGLIAGGLTTAPPVNLGPNLLQNPGFEILAGGQPSGWTSGAGWGADQVVVRSGAASYRRTTGAATSAQTLQLRAGTYLLSAWIKTEGLGSGATSGVRLQVDFRAGGINAWMPSDVISGTNDWKLYEVGPVVVETDRTATIKLENYNAAAGTAWFDDVRFVQVLPQPVSAFLLYPNYRGMLFDDQPQTITLDVAVTPPAGDFGRHSVKAVLSDETTGAIVAQRSYASGAQLVAALDGTAMQPGRAYLATVSLVDLSTNATVSTYPAYRVSKVAASVRQTMNVSFDAKNRVLLKGVPRFVLGVYDSGLGYSTDPAFWESRLWSATGDRRMAGLGINMYLNYWYGQAPTDAMAALMNNLQQHGVMYLQTGNCFDKFPADPTFQINSSDAYVQTVGAHRGSAGYYTIDECRSALQPGAFTQYQRLRQLDPDSLTFAALFGDPEISLWRDSADVLSSDPYPLFGAEPAGGYNLAQVADWTARTRTAVKSARPIMTVLQFFKFTSLGRFPTLTELRSMAYMAVVEGAGGLWWWSLGTNALQDVCAGWCAEKTAHMDNLKSVVNEVAGLEDILLADDAPEALVANSNSAIRTKVKIVGGRGYVFAYNDTRTPQTAAFTWRTSPGTVTVHAEGRTAGVAGSVFTDTFGPFQAHVYVVDNGGGGSPLTAAFTSPAADATVSGTVPVTVTASGGSDSGYTYAIALNGVVASSGPSPNLAWNTTTVANGVHALSALVTDSRGATTTVTRSVTVANVVTPPPPPAPPTLTLRFDGKIRDRVGQGNKVLAGDGALDGVVTVTLGGGARAVTALTLESTGPGVWDTDGSNGYWVLGVATSVDGPLLNNLATTAVDLPLASGGTFVVFASDYNGIEFLPGNRLTLTATFADGTRATAATTVPAPSSAAALTIAYNGKLRDRVGQGNTALAADGALDGTVTATLRASGGRTITKLRLDSTGPGIWDTDGANQFWALGVSTSMDGALLNKGTTTAVSFPVTDGGSFVLFASDYGEIEFLPGARLTLTATFVDGTTATAVTTVAAATSLPALTLVYDGKLRDRVGQGNTALTGDGPLDGTLTATVRGTGTRTVTALRLESSAPGVWDTDGGNGYWALGVATTLDGGLLNHPGTTAVSLPLPDGSGSFVLFASDYNGIEFLPGTTLTLRATFSDATTAVAVYRVP